MKTKKKPRIKAKTRQIPQLELFLLALAQLYPNDKLSPGVHIAYLPKELQFYASVKRYNSANPRDFETLASVKAVTSADATAQLIKQWFDANNYAIRMFQAAKKAKVRK